MFNAKEAVSRRVLQQILVLSILVVWVKVENKVLKTKQVLSLLQAFWKFWKKLTRRNAQN